MTVEYITAQGCSCQAEHIKVTATILQAFALLDALANFLERSSLENGIDGTVCHLYVDEPHDARRDAIPLTYLKLRFATGSQEHRMRTVAQVP